MTRARFVVTNVAMLAVVFALWRAGAFGLASFPVIEWLFLLLLALYGAVGFIAGVVGYWDELTFISNSLPRWALSFTGLGMMLAVSNLRSLEPAQLVSVFRDLVMSLLPNIFGVTLMSWLAELKWRCVGEDI